MPNFIRVYLALFFSLFVSVPAAYSADYYWMYQNVGTYDSAQSACSANGYPDTIYWTNAVYGTCSKKVTNSDGSTSVRAGGFTSRGGTACPNGGTYNDTTHSCAAALKDGDKCADQTGSTSAENPMIWSSKSNKCVLYSDSDDDATCGYLGGLGGSGTSYKVAGNWDGGTPSAPPVFTQDGLSCEVGTVSTTDCVSDIHGAVTCNVVGKLTGKASNKTNIVDAKDAACPGGVCTPVEANTSVTNDPCVYSGSGSVASCVSDSNTSKDGTQQCGTVNGAMTCVTTSPSSNGIKIASTVTTTANPDGGTTAVKTDNATKTTCTGINKCTSTTSSTTTTTKTNAAGQATSTHTVCTGTCGASGTGIGSGSASGNGTGDEASGSCTSEDCGSGGAGGLHDPENGNFDGQSADWDKKIEDGKKDLKDRIDKMKTAFDPLSQAGLGGGGGQLYCPPAVPFLGHDISFCLDKFTGSLSWIASAVYAACALAALFIIFL